MTRRSLSESAPILAWLAPLWLLTILFLPPASLLLALAILFTLFFFRDPPRTPPPDESLAVAPADGLIVSVEECDGDGTIPGPVRRITIFLSIFDVHINRSPISGQIERSDAHTGLFLDARKPQSSEFNARRTWLIRNTQHCAVVRQITGAIARRICAWKQPGDFVQRADRIGMIRFGSRTELDLPLDYQILVQPGQRCKGGETPVAKLPTPP